MPNKTNQYDSLKLKKTPKKKRGYTQIFTLKEKG